MNWRVRSGARVTWRVRRWSGVPKSGDELATSVAIRLQGNVDSNIRACMAGRSGGYRQQTGWWDRAHDDTLSEIEQRDT